MLYKDIGIVEPSVDLTGNHQVVFLHIPRTAGTTFESILFRNFRLEDVSPYHLSEDLLTILPEKNTHHRFHFGHFFYALIKRYVSDNAIFLTFLRDPIERALSDYSGIQRSGVSEFGAGISLEDFVFEPQWSKRLTNLQTRLLGAALEASTKEDLYAVWAEERQLAMNGTGAKAEGAYAVLKTFPFFGITERFNDSVALFSCLFGWQPVFSVQKLNTATSGRLRQEDVPTRVIDRLIEINHEDIKLYNDAMELFESRFGEMVQRLTWQNHSLFKISSTPRVSELIFNFDRQDPVDGWYEAERYLDGTYYAWSGPEPRSTLELPIADGFDIGIMVCVIDAASIETLESLAISINDFPVQLTRVNAVNGFIFSGIIPDGAIQKDRYFSKITFEVQRTSTMLQGPDDNNPRKLGLAFKWLQILPARKVRRSQASAPLSSGGMSAKIEVTDEDVAMSPGEIRDIQIKVENVSKSTWYARDNSAGNYGVRLGCYWRDSNGNPVFLSESRAELPYDFEPGDRETLAINLVAPQEPGQYFAYFDMVQGGVNWFTRGGKRPQKIHISVAPSSK